METEKISGISTRQKVFLASAIIALGILGVLLFILNYSNLSGTGSGSSDAAKALEQERLMRQLEANYRQDFPAVIAAYLDQGQVSADDARDRLLELRVPSVYRDTHLSAVLSLEDAAKAEAAGDQESLASAQDDLRLLLGSF